MKLTASFKRGVAQVKREWRAGRYERALSAVNRLLKDWPDNPQLLIQWGNLIQLQSDEPGATLDEAQAALHRAVDLDEESPSAWKELGHFLSAVEDDAPGTSRCFDKTISLCRGMLAEASWPTPKRLRNWSGAKRRWRASPKRIGCNPIMVK